MDTAAYSGQNHEAQEFVLDMNSIPESRMRSPLNKVDDGQRVDAAAASLIDAFVEEEGIGIGGRRCVGEHRNGGTPGFNGANFAGRGWRQFEFGRIGRSQIAFVCCVHYILPHWFPLTARWNAEMSVEFGAIFTCTLPLVSLYVLCFALVKQ